MPATIDHLVVRSPDLEAGTSYVAEALGIALVEGGRHADMGTHNRLANIGGPYLEVIAVDPEAGVPEHARWFDLDSPPASARLAAWVARVADLPAIDELGPPRALARGDLSWSITVREDGSIPFDGAGPMLITWHGDTPSLPPDEARLISLTVMHPEPARLQGLLHDLDLAAPVTVQESGTARLVAAFETPLGSRIIDSDGNGFDVVSERQAAMDLFHLTWLLLDRQDRLAEHDAAMIACAEASLWHWRRVGAPTQWAIGEWQCSRVQAVLGHGRESLAHAQRCLDIASQDRVDDFVPASAHEALARAYAALGDYPAARAERNAAYRIALELDDEDRDVIEHDLGTIPIPQEGHP